MMTGKLQFRRITQELVDTEAQLDDAEFPAGEFLMARKVWLKDGPELWQHRPTSGSQRRDGYERLDNEILAGRRLYEVADWGRYPPEVACLYGDEATSAEPYALFEPYQGRPLSEVGTYILDEEFDEFQASLLAGLCWLAAAGIAHRGINPDTVLWDSQQHRVQITDFSKCTVFGVPRTPVTGSSAWIPKEQRPGTVYGSVGPRDDMWAAGQLIFFVQNQGEDLVDRRQITASGLDTFYNGMFDQVLGPPERRPTASELLEHGLRRRNRLPDAAAGSARLKTGRARFLEARQRRHPDAMEPPRLNDDIDWMTDPGAISLPARGGEVPPAATGAGPADTQQAGTSWAGATQADDTQPGATALADDRPERTGRSRQFPWKRGD